MSGSLFEIQCIMTPQWVQSALQSLAPDVFFQERNCHIVNYYYTFHY